VIPEKRRAVNVVVPVPICAVEREAKREQLFAMKVACSRPFGHH